MEFLDASMDYPNEIKIKVIIVGKCKTGKSTFNFRIKTKNYSEFKSLNKSYLSTVGFEFFSEKIKIKNKILHFQLWDTCGQELYQALVRNFYKFLTLLYYNNN